MTIIIIIILLLLLTTYIIMVALSQNYMLQDPVPYSVKSRNHKLAYTTHYIYLYSPYRQQKRRCHKAQKKKNKKINNTT